MSIKAKINSQIFQDSNNIYYPKNESEVSELIRELYKKDSPTEIIGNNSKSFIGNKAQSANTMSLSKLTGIIDYRPEELYIKVKACTPIEEVEKILDENNQELAFEPIDFGYIKNGASNKGTVAGYLSCNYAGSRRFKVGSVRDHVLGFKGVNGKGDIIKSGGTVVKNVTGYDLSKLIAGSFGTLVALTEITLKVLPKKDSSNTIAIYIDKSEEIFDLFIKLSSSSSEISGAVYVPNKSKDDDFLKKKNSVFKFNDLKSNTSFLAFRVEGDKISIKEKIKNLSKELELDKFETSTLDVYQSEPFWQKINNLEIFENTKNNLIRMVIPPAKGSNLFKFLDNKYKYFVDWCGSLFWIEVDEQKEEKIKELKKIALESGGYLTVIKTSADYDYGESIFTVDDIRLMISEKIKKSFDPKRILNPGKMYRGI
ncbi:FAD-binding protein [Candidatus Pelagibacter sp. HIMB1542]|uniref:FAD-binding protein n=1 Tax=Candidatus Pelagibacter sp. HIMB1542 TaxID=3413346 RepID=UPI003F8331BC